VDGRPWGFGGAFAALSLFAMAVDAAGAPAEAPRRSSTPELIEPHLVDIGGRRLNLVCMGEGSPTVVFDLPLAGDLLVWRKVARSVAKVSRACFYDRAGYGFSDPSPRPMTVRNVAEDLHALLEAARIDGPVVLVGHSMGGYYATMFADLYPEKTAGLVLIDPAYAGAGLASVQSNAEAQKDEDDAVSMMRRCAELARAGQLTRADPKGCFRLDPGSPPDEVAFLAWPWMRPFKYEAIASEFQTNFSLEHGRDENSLEETEAARAWDALPVIVLTSGGNFARADRKAERDAEWKAGHDRLAARSTRGVSETIADSGHYIQLDRPEAVILAIETIVGQVRQDAQRR
jgi:pimeloyl-ACP methyl ester carboxylesterase